ncbi:MAG: deoxyribodipyrimidine photo-lyase [Anaerolineae bacterium]|nr:deoxyribodipyrimidine photo-lyase [Gloeobacterales cyanobacterium ES-bin-313]
MSKPIAIVWHRRDLRVHDNPALHQAVSAGHTVLGLFIVDTEALCHRDMAPARVYYLRESVNELQFAYQKLGGRLSIRQGNPVEVLKSLVEEVGASALFFNDDIEPDTRKRDDEVLQALKIPVHLCADLLLHPPQTVLTQGGQPYSVYTPFWRNWSVRVKPKPAVKPDRLVSPDHPLGHFPELVDLGFHFSPNLLVVPGEAAARKQLADFCTQSIYDYDDRRDAPALPGTSLLSAALNFGTVGIREVWQSTQQAWQAATHEDQRRNLTVWQQELGWREFYKYVLFHFPRLAEQPFRPQFAEFVWDEDQERFERWCRGETGYPLVDAAMRQLNTVSWMHNRLRMVVASFLTKDLLINWQWGERYFMQKLVDGDLSANNGGWQWAASVGTDPKPLRIFNPSTQAQRYDTQAHFIRKWVSELKDVDTRSLLDVERFLPLERARFGYPVPMVDHKEQQQIFKERYRQVPKRSDFEQSSSD